MNHSTQLYNTYLSPSDAISADDITDTKVLVFKLKTKIYNSASIPDRVSVSSPHASAWLSVIPSPRSQYHEPQVTLK